MTTARFKLFDCISKLEVKTPNKTTVVKFEDPEKMKVKYDKKPKLRAAPEAKRDS